jgi:hypothetical protein
VRGTETTLNKIATIRHATPEAVPWNTLHARRSRKSRGAPRLKVKLAQRRMVEVKERDDSASGRLRWQIRLS